MMGERSILEALGSSSHQDYLKEKAALSNPVHLTLVVAETPHTSRIRNGSIPIEGVDVEIITVDPMIAAFRRMVRNVEFDICAVAPVTYVIARAYGYPFKALPIFIQRGFHHGGLLVRPDAGIKVPKDLEGKKVGVRAYSVTSGAWTRAVLIDEYGLDSSKVTWVVDDEEHVTKLTLPPNVVRTPEGKSLNGMMADGELAAGLAGLAGIGRIGSPTSGWKPVETDYPDLFANPAELEADWYKRTGIYPVHDTIVVKDSVLAEHPWVAKSIFNAFSQAKNEWLAGLDSRTDLTGPEKKYANLRKLVGPDPLPYGIEANLPTIKALEDTAFKQGFTPRRMSVEELFVDPEKL
jgi:4,5-dihydroxyphthalate decarboxylase